MREEFDSCFNRAGPENDIAVFPLHDAGLLSLTSAAIDLWHITASYSYNPYTPHSEFLYPEIMIPR